MSKMTTEQFLSHLGIEVGQEFRIKTTYRWKYSFFKIEKIGYDFKLLEKSDGDWDIVSNTIGWLLDKEITPLPKYTLTEDEKAIVRNMSDKIDFLGKDGVNLYGQIEGREPFWLPFNDVFNFIGQGIRGEVSLDELRKCL